MKRLVFILFFGVLLGCSSKQKLDLSSQSISGSLQLIPSFQQLPDQSMLVYQEIAQSGSGQVLDSLIVEEELLEVPLVAYVQQHFNQLRLHGYEISDEVTQKKTPKIGTETSQNLAILKTYRISNMLGVKLYAAQYHVQLGERVLTLSYASDHFANRKAFIDSLNQISFNL